VSWWVQLIATAPASFLLGVGAGLMLRSRRYRIVRVNDKR
jgi:hypothetical protein